MNDKQTSNMSLEEKYRQIRPIYQSLSEVVKNILDCAIPKNVAIHSIEHRAKTIKSFLEKSAKADDNTPEKQKYENPLSDITDLAGVRVIVFFPKSLNKVGDAIENEFDVIWKKDIGEERFAEGKFGYKSIHYLVKIPEEKTGWAEYNRFENLIAEIQVRTILQHAWAEMEHDIQYKSSEQIPSSIQRRFLALAGMIEIADREFQSIQDEDSKIRETLSASLQDDLTEAVESVETTSQRSSFKDAKDILMEWNPTRARQLISDGNYEEAINHYSDLILQQPESYTLYIGRAKARFLNGDRISALEDLQHAETLQPNDPVIVKTRSQIEEGVLGASSAAEAWQLVSSANNMLAKGDGDEAFRMYSQAQQLGFNAFFSTFNKAMACALNKDADSALYFLNEYTPNKDSPSEVNTLALQVIASYIGKRGHKRIFSKLKERINSLPGFDFNQSPLRYLKKGFQEKDKTVSPEIMAVFDLLIKNSNYEQ